MTSPSRARSFACAASARSSARNALGEIPTLSSASRLTTGGFLGYPCACFTTMTARTALFSHVVVVVARSDAGDARAGLDGGDASDGGVTTMRNCLRSRSSNAKSSS
eukprot:30109-Pelagococcus_subviridis.AAC.7